jgi:tetratricopeptide (TPR) repeat protein
MTVDDRPTDGNRKADAREARWRLTDERDFLRRSLHDALREHAAGDLSDEDRRVLVVRDRKRLAEVEAELEALGSPHDGIEAHQTTPTAQTRSASGWRRIAIVSACFLIAAGAVILVTHARQSRQPGQASSGSITLSQAALIEGQLTQAQNLENVHNSLAALKIYNKVLSEDPTNPAAMAGAGWVTWNTGFYAHVPSLTAAGRKEVEREVKMTPSYYGGHLFLGLILFNQDENYTAAVTQFNDFVFDTPPPTLVLLMAPYVEGAYKAAGVPLPSAYIAPTTSSTSTSAP